MRKCQDIAYVVVHDATASKISTLSVGSL